MVYDRILGSITQYYIEKMKVSVPSPEQFMEIMQVATSVTMERLTDIKQAIKEYL